MTDELSTIYNNNKKNMPSEDIYKSFNDFIFSNDTKIMGKMLHRYDFFCETKHLPGDIVEVGVFKGSGVASFSKFIDIYAPNSNKKIIGFDFFNPSGSDKMLEKDACHDKQSMNIVYGRCDHDERELSSVMKRLDGMNIDKKYMLIEGDVEETIPEFIRENPGFRISLLYIDVDIERPTYCALKYLWDRVLPGGIIVFDEFEYHKFTESCGVEKFLKERNLDFTLQSTNWIAPTSFIVKQNFS
jgi:hypothetical protein